MVSTAVHAAVSVSHHHVCGCHVAPPNLQPVPRYMSPVVLARRPRVLVSRAKFDKFDAVADGPPPTPESANSEVSAVAEVLELDEDSDLPSDLEGAIRQSSQASALFVSAGGMRAIVELLIPQLQFLDDEGAQAELWELSKIFLESFMEELGNQRVKAIFPDAGAAALLKYQWKDAKFGFSRL